MRWFFDLLGSGFLPSRGPRRSTAGLCGVCVTLDWKGDGRGGKQGLYIILL